MNQKVELSPPDIAAYRNGNTGIEYFTTFVASEPGPHVAVTAVVHGNELCGAIALDHLFSNDIRPRRGKLTLGFVNVAAFLSFDADDPAASRYVDEDFNRLWSSGVLKSDRTSQELRRAREIEPLVSEFDLLLDLHSMQTDTQALTLAGQQDKGLALAKAVGAPAHIVRDIGHQAGKRMRDYAAFDEPHGDKASLLVECGQHWRAATGTMAIDVAYRFLAATGVISDDLQQRHQQLPTPEVQKVIQVSGPVTVQNDGFTFVDDYVGLEVIPEKGTILGYDGATPVMTPYDNCVLIMPSQRLTSGMTAVRLGQFVE